ncbi:hypothetical protein V6N12_010567 [Hibiscus sabdariffa]|uniref:Uncharacterized protein n=1 Tax=Hibiscus sabdariffa TaxID=183260 RepID=A0ABR2EM60_9ROSI
MGMMNQAMRHNSASKGVMIRKRIHTLTPKDVAFQTNTKKELEDEQVEHLFKKKDPFRGAYFKEKIPEIDSSSRRKDLIASMARSYSLRNLLNLKTKRG